jgi:integrase
MSTPLRTPSLRRHRTWNLGVVTLNGKYHYLGHWPANRKNPPEPVRQAYDKLIAEWLAAGRRLQPVPSKQPEGVSINELLLAFWRHAEQHYRDAMGVPTDELENLRDALRPLKELYGTLPAVEFSPLKLKAVRQKLLDARRFHVRFKLKDGDEEKSVERWVGERAFRQSASSCEALWKKKWRTTELIATEKALSRGVINQRVRRIVRAFRWAVAEELIPESVYRALSAVPGLQQGRTEAPEGEGVKPVAVDVVKATLPKMPAPSAAMSQLQLLTGMRAGEVMVMRAIDLNTSGATWTYTPHKHKNKHRGMERIIYLGPKAQEIIRPFLTTDLEAYLFSPRAFVAVLHAKRGAERKSKRTPSEFARKRTRKPTRQPAERYSRRSYRQAIVRACRAAGVPAWSPLQLRHTAATHIRARYGIEATKVILGHARVETSQIYAERDLNRAQEIMREIG